MVKTGLLRIRKWKDVFFLAAEYADYADFSGFFSPQANPRKSA